MAKQQLDPNAGIADKCFVLYKASGFTDDSFAFCIDNYAKNTPFNVGNDIQDDIRSARWNLPNGIIVVLCADENGTGKKYTMWGKLQDPEFNDSAFGDDIDSWYWTTN